MKAGETYSYLTDDENPLRSPNTHAVSALLTAGGRLADCGAYTHTLSEQGGKQQRSVTWLMKEIPIEIGGETISTAEFLRRWRDREWAFDHPDHPIAWMKAYQGNLTAMREQIRGQLPQIRIQRGKRTYTLTTKLAEDGSLVPDEMGEKLLKQF
jgi:hypothetical protein